MGVAAALVFVGLRLIQRGDSGGAPAAGVEQQPLYAERLSGSIASAGYFPVQGTLDKEGKNYHCRLRTRVPIVLYAYPDNVQAVCTGFYACGRLRLQETLEQEEARDILAKILSEYVAGPDRSAFSQWLWTAFPDCLDALKAGRDFSREELFGEIAVRVEHCRMYNLGTGIAVAMRQAPNRE